MKKKKEKPENSERWLLTYSDLITLLMVLFVILYAASNVDKTKYAQIAASLKAAFSIGESGKVAVVNQSGSNGDAINENQSSKTATQTPQSQTAQTTEQNKLSEIQAEIEKLLAEAGLSNKVSTKIEDRGLVISFVDNIFFDSGQAVIKDEYKSDLVSISQILNKIDNYIRIEGHTDNVAISTPFFSSNWQLSSIRASNVVQVLIDDGKINADRLSAVGYGEYRPVASNDTEEGRAANRRVDIVILNSKYNQSESK